MEHITKILGHDFKDKNLLVKAFTHRSVSSANDSYERLEFIGDRVIGLAVSDILIEKFPNAKEGELARRHTAIVRAEALAEIAKQCDFGKYIRVSDNSETMQSNEKILSDVVEACAGALYIDGGMDAVMGFFKKFVLELVDVQVDDLKDSKTRLQEWAQKNKHGIPSYEISERTGPDHSPEFAVKVSVSGFDDVSGTGKSKQEASQNAALNFMKENNLNG
ncbi:MAG: ribonuclease III [Alphaproteobacteria bacterium]